MYKIESYTDEYGTEHHIYTYSTIQTKKIRNKDIKFNKMEVEIMESHGGFFGHETYRYEFYYLDDKLITSN